MVMTMEAPSLTQNTIKDTSGDMTFFNMVNCSPKFLLRFLSILFSIVVFGCISAAGVDPDTDHCIFHQNPDACHYGLAIPLIAFIASLLFIAIDLQFNSMCNDMFRRYLLGCEFFFSTLWTFLWFVGFCFLANEWRLSPIRNSSQNNHARAAIAFSFLSVFTWGGLSVMAWTRYRHIGSLQRAYETLPNEADYTIEFDKNAHKYSIFPEVRAGHGSPYMHHDGPQYVVPGPPQGRVLGTPRSTYGR